MATGTERVPSLRAWLRPALVVALVAFPIFLIPTEPWRPEPVWSAGAGVQSLGVFAGIFAIAAYSLGLLMRFLNLPSGANAALFGVGAYASGLAMTRLDLGFWPALVVAVLATAVVGAAVGALSLRTIGLAFLIITIALGELIVLVLRNWEDLTNGPVGLFVTSPPSPAPGADVDERLVRYYIVLAFLYGTVVAVWLLSRSRFGQRLVAIRDNTRLARSLGLEAFRYKLACFVVSAAIAGVAGHLYMIHLKAITPDLFVAFAFIPVFLMVVMGGVGTLAGPAVGAWLVIFLPEWFEPIGLEDPTRQELVFGALLIAFMLLAPRGIVGSLSALLDRVTPPSRTPVSIPRPAWTHSLSIRLPGRRRAGVATAAEDRPAGGRPVRGDHGLVLEEASRSFGAVRALDGVSLRVEPGEIVGIIGPNGSGKTTLLNCVSGFIPLTGGRAVWGGHNLSGKRPETIARFGVLRTFQQPMAFASYTPKEHCELFRMVEGSPGDAKAVLELAGISEVKDVPASDLSYGQIRNLGVAVAVATQLPELLMLDEPAAGLGGLESAGLRESLLELRRKGLTLVIVDHDMSFLMPMCDRVIVLDAGRKIAEGTPAEIQHDAGVIAAYLGERFARTRGPEEPAS